MQRLHELAAQFFDGEITPIEYRNGVLNTIMQEMFDEKELEQFCGLFIAMNG